MADKTSFLGAYSPWSSRSVTPKSMDRDASQDKTKSKDDGDIAVKASQNATEQAFITHYKLSSRDYPKDCPRLNAQWYYATDEPKFDPQHPLKKFAAPKKYSGFSSRDSQAIEKAFQDLVEKEAQQKDEVQASHQRSKSDVGLGSTQGASDPITTGSRKNEIEVPVNEDFLFDVGIQQRELRPAYWSGSVYDVRRGSWFRQEGQNLKPLDENLAAQLEQGYLKIKPWRLQAQPGSREASPKGEKQQNADANKGGTEPKEGSERAETQSVEKAAKDENASSQKFEMQTQRLFGKYSTSVVTYTDVSTAWVLTDDLYDRMSSTVWQRFAGGGHLGGTKVLRGYRDLSTNKDGNKEEEKAKRSSGVTEQKEQEQAQDAQDEDNPTMRKLERQMSSLNVSQQEAEDRKESEKEIRESYVQAEGEDQGREIEHLILVTHGIGQNFTLKPDMLNFIADVNMMRKTIKAVYKSSPDLQLLNSEVENPSNCRVQVLPIVWRTKLDFPDHGFKKNREKEQDLADSGEEEENPSLKSITPQDKSIIRTAIQDLGLDILVFQSAYRDRISEIVVSECNRVYKAFKKRNPDFKGKISLAGHSLGSAILFDVLCQQKYEDFPSRSRPSSVHRPSFSKQQTRFQLDFDVEDYYCLGSPLGLYQMLNGQKIIGRPRPSQETRPFSPNSEAFESASKSEMSTSNAHSAGHGKPAPKCSQLFNIFHPADPIAYRLEPLISTAMSSIDPQRLPYTKKGMFDVQGQGFSAIGNKVGQSVSGLWSSVSGGMAASLLNRTLGVQQDASQSGKSANAMRIQPKPDGESSDEGLQMPPTLIDDKLETLYAGFEKSRRLQQSDESRDLGESSQWTEAEKRSKSMKREEAKVRALNINGRVDYVIDS